MPDLPPERKRRVRYSGTHPRKFDEKYKELNPERYAAEIEKVKGRGQTPAGSHLAICVDEIIAALRLRPGMAGVDCTLGYGGHSLEMLRRITPGGSLIGLDVDPIELEKAARRIRDRGYDGSAFTARHMNFSSIEGCLSTVPGGFDFILADLGVSSMQLDTPDRGFSYKNSAPLDLRLDSSAGETAAVLLRRVSAEYLANLLVENADEPYAGAIAKAIHGRSAECQTTDGLGGVVSEALSACGVRPDDAKSSLQRTFQALRIAVNDEFGSLDGLLLSIPRCLKPGGRVAVLTFHSGEDRRVKKAFKAGVSAGLFSECVRRPERPSPRERRDNPRSTCAKLRWAVKA
ncbi:MAG: 16S rRNA (cytosine(1402)-N(4))-methyltransferase RsmH [Spirochaetes bacterium]|nr:16S rRNA (cytosine(1402)-N(4))-methyltransferase RsmH [Spirochaetota bacterium]MBU1079980.1 16S rRNA (cytosine(1402)-N(4))-methyltransferase RsmH [Spirochaetota bacterium]